MSQSAPAPAPLRALARAAGVATEWVDAFGVPQRVPEETLARVLCALGHACGSAAEQDRSRAALAAPRSLPALLTAEVGRPVVLPGVAASAEAVLEGEAPRRLGLRPHAAGAQLTAPDAPGYHLLRIGPHSVRLAVAPRAAPSVAALTGRARTFGVAAQVYSLRAGLEEGVGDLGAAADLAERLAACGAQALALSPLHALFSAAPERFSPYAPSSRLALNPLLADPAACLPADAVAAARRAAGPAGQAPDGLIDWPAAARRKLAVLRDLFARLDALPETAERFSAFAATVDADIRRHALFEALHGAMLACGRGFDWRQWPADLRDPDSRAVADFARDEAQDVRFHLFLQWIAERSLEAAQHRAEAAGMGIGLITDLAVGLDPAGSQAWGRPDDLLAGLAIGAPPDLLNTDGQNWGLTAISPTALAAQGFAPFLRAIRAALRHAGGVRIDHILGLGRLWLVPDGAGPGAGAYLAYPLRDLLRLAALEAHVRGALVIGEDLGTVPEGLREEMAERGILGLRVLAFERDADGGFTPPRQWQAEAVAMTSTHDLPTVAGWWGGRDLDWRARVAGTQVSSAARAVREEERRAFAQAAVAAGVAGAPGLEATPGVSTPADAEHAVDAAIAFVAATPCALALVPLEDLAGCAESPNLPGTSDAHPNWRRRMAAPAETLLAAPAIAARLTRLKRARGAGQAGA